MFLCYNHYIYSYVKRRTAITLEIKLEEGVGIMKFCPYCGASLVGGAASFCAECGKQIPVHGAKSTSMPPLRKHRSIGAEKRQGSHPASKHPPKQKKNPMDINYDGYYNDVKPIDAGQQRDRLDPELIKKVILLVAGALGVILLAIAFMALL